MSTESNSTPGSVAPPVAPGPAVPPEGHEERLSPSKDDETPKGDDQGPRYGWTLSGFKAREAAKKFSEGMISGPGAGTAGGG
jgi:hypothetical protein